MRILSLTRIDEVDQDAWNALTSSSNPFIKHEFLCSLEHAGCVMPETGWTPCHIVATEGNRLLGALRELLGHLGQWLQGAAEHAGDGSGDAGRRLG